MRTNINLYEKIGVKTTTDRFIMKRFGYAATYYHKY